MKSLNPIKTPELQTGKPDISMAPLIDVVFLLLIFFMVTTVFPEDHALVIEKPESKTADTMVVDKMTFVVDQQGKVEFNKQTILIDDIEMIVSDQLRSTPGTAVLIKIDKQTPTGIFIKVLDACKLAGAKQVGIATDVVTQ